jgi:hypothetical protein
MEHSLTDQGEMAQELANTGKIGARELRIVREQANRIEAEVPHVATMLRTLADAVEDLRHALWHAEDERDHLVRRLEFEQKDRAVERFRIREAVGPIAQGIE